MMTEDELVKLVYKALVDLKGVDIVQIDVRDITTISDWMVIVSGNSDRHVKSLSDNLCRSAKRAGARILGVEGEREGEWVLIDLGEVIVHVMLPRVREFYALEKLWQVDAGGEDAKMDA